MRIGSILGDMEQERDLPVYERSQPPQKNIERMNAKAISMGKEPHYNEENIANKFAFITADKPGRTTIILVGEDLGY